jgi:uncharacterized phage-associated protein
MNVTYDEAKFAELLLYVADRLRDDTAGGATKLNKVLYFAEFVHVRRAGRPISGVEFQKLSHGPAPRRLRPVRDALVRSGAAALVVDDRLGFALSRLIPTRPADLSLFSADELVSVHHALAHLDGLTARQASELSHEETGWRLVADGETIPYEAAFAGAPQIETPTSRRLELDTAKRLGLITT